LLPPIHAVDGGTICVGGDGEPKGFLLPLPEAATSG